MQIYVVCLPRPLLAFSSPVPFFRDASVSFIAFLGKQETGWLSQLQFFKQKTNTSSSVRFKQSNDVSVIWVEREFQKKCIHELQLITKAVSFKFWWCVILMGNFSFWTLWWTFSVISFFLYTVLRVLFSKLSTPPRTGYFKIR